MILPPDLELEGLNDSKKLSEKRREALYPLICEQALAYGIAFASEQEIDELNILQATFLAMRRAVGQLGQKPDLALVDGNREPDFGDIPVRTIIKGDSRSANIAAASILAKVTRDRFMLEQDAVYPQYGFAVHKGYGTREALRRPARIPPLPHPSQELSEKNSMANDLLGRWGETLRRPICKSGATASSRRITAAASGRST